MFIVKVYLTLLKVIMHDMHKFREQFINGIIAIFRLLFFWIKDDYTLGKTILRVHAFIILIPIGIFFLLPVGHILKLIFLILGLIMAASQILFKGCMFTAAEQRLTKEKVTVMDPIIRLIPCAPTKELMLGLTVGMGFTSTMIGIWVVLTDYIKLYLANKALVATAAAIPA